MLTGTSPPIERYLSTQSRHTLRYPGFVYDLVHCDTVPPLVNIHKEFENCMRKFERKRNLSRLISKKFLVVLKFR